MLSETLAQYSALMVMKQQVRRRREMRRFLKYELDRYLRGRGTEQQEGAAARARREPAYIHYRKGALVDVRAAGRDRRGRVDERCRASSKRWHSHGPPYASSVDLIAEFRARDAARLQSLIADLFETITLYDVRAISATAKPKADGGEAIDLVVSAKKVRADGAGNESEVPFDGEVDIGVLDDKGEVVSIEKRRVHSGENRFALTAKAGAARAGIDPLGKLIDRDADDNTVAVTR